MLIRPQLQRNTTPIITHSINKIRYKSSQGTSTPLRGSSVSRKFSPGVNKSFACYQDLSNPKNRSLSVGKYKNSSLNITPKTRHRSSLLKNRNLRSSSKLKKCEIEEPKIQKEEMQFWIDQGVSELKSGEFSAAISSFSKVLKEDPKHADCLFNRACCFMNKGEYKLAVPDLLVICTDSPLYKKNLYIALGICFANLQDLNSAIRHLTKGLQKYSKFREGYVARGQLYLQLFNWEKAVQDFSKAISLNPDEGSAYMGLGDALAGKEDRKNAIKVYTKAVQCKPTAQQALLKRAKLYYELRDFSRSLADLEQSLSHNCEDPEAYYYKSMVLLTQDNLTEAALCLEQVIKFDMHSKKYTGAALYDLGAIRIKQKDYYGALHTFKRATNCNVEIKEQKVLRGYVEAILLLMKRKFKEGVSQLSRIIKKKEQPILQYIGNCYAFRAYGLASLEKHEQAVKNLNNASKIQELDKASQYNLSISSAWIIAEKSPERSLRLLELAQQDFPKNPESLAYQAAIHFSQSRKTGGKKLGEKAKGLLDKAVLIKDTDWDLYFFRGVVLYYLGKPVEAIPEYETAIDKSEDNMPIHFIARGLCYAQLKLLKEASQDFSIAIQLKEDMSEAYYYRGRCNFLLDDSEQAFQDYQKMIVTKNEDPVSHINAGNLLMVAGSADDAGKAYSNANFIKATKEGFIQRAKCYLSTEKYDLVFADLQSAKELGARVEADMEVLKILTSATDSDGIAKKLSQISKIKSSDFSVFFKSKHVHWYKGAFLFMLNEFQKAKKEFKAALDTQCQSEDPSTEKDNTELVYNLSLCYIMCEQLETALANLQELLYVLQTKDRGKILLLIGILNIALGQNDRARTVMLESFKFDPETSSAYLEENSSIELLPFPRSDTENNYPLKEVKIRNAHTIFVRPSLGFPFVSLPSLGFKVESFVLDQFSVKSVKCRPEAPWLNRVRGEIQFTEEIKEINCDSVASDLKADSDEESSVFDLSLSEFKVFRSFQVFGKSDSCQSTAELLNCVRLKESPSKVVMTEASEEVRKKIDSICSSVVDD